MPDHETKISHQRDNGVRFEWASSGAAAIAEPAAATVIVDVLSFSTPVTIAVGRGMAIFPHPWPSPDAEAFAADHHAMCAVRRRQVDRHHPWSLSPAHLLVAPFVERLVLPSPNGSAIAATVAGQTVIAGCLRNASSVGQWLSSQGFGTSGRPWRLSPPGNAGPTVSCDPRSRICSERARLSPRLTAVPAAHQRRRPPRSRGIPTATSSPKRCGLAPPAESSLKPATPMTSSSQPNMTLRPRSPVSSDRPSAPNSTPTTPDPRRRFRAIRTIRATPGQREDGTRAHTGPGHPIAALSRRSD